jgi:flavin reductase (DIM6/NTAB) family NADH-FMN oxidoreductase RutF
MSYFYDINTSGMFNKLFRKTEPGILKENVFRLINKDWMLITAGNAEHFNTMTASWGTLGILWNKPIAICFIRPQRFTFEFTEKHPFFTLSFFDAQYKDILNYCGKYSGRNVDKITKTGLKPVLTPLGNITFEQCRLVLECEKLYSDYLKEDNFTIKTIISAHYPGKDFHKFYIGEISGCYMKI